METSLLTVAFNCKMYIIYTKGEMNAGLSTEYMYF